MTPDMQQIREAVEAAVKKVSDRQETVELTRPDEQFGDFSTNVALKLAKDLGQNPRQLAEQIAQAIAHADIEQASVAGPGFINLTLTDSALMQAANLPVPRPLDGKRLLTEYSDPNPFKPLHAGHLYTTIVGDVMARLLEAVGAQVTRLNYGGDVGRHVGISMWAIIKKLGGEYPEKLSEIPETERPAWLGVRYVEGTAAFELDEAAKPEILSANKRVYEVHAAADHDSPFAQIYWTCRQWSYDYFQTLYEQLQVVPFDRYIPESEVTPLGVRTVQEQVQNGVFTQSEGAIVYNGEERGLHTRVFINSEGLPTYETKDVGLSLTKWQDYKFDNSIIITANEQAQYMQVVLSAIAQFAPEAAERTTHLTHGVVKLQGGIKMSSRKGNVVTALEILESARAAAAAGPNQAHETGVLAAVKYSFLKNRIGGDVVYDPSESVALEGNSGPYLQYAHARARSILRKAAASPQAVNPSDLQQDERSLARMIGRYPEVVLLAADELMPHHVCGYLYDLAQNFNRFYEKNRVVGDEREQIRLWLVQSYADRLKAGLGLLGIVSPDTM